MLAARWSLCSTPAVADAHAPPHDAHWLEIAGPTTAAAALRGIGRWGIDGPRVDFDEEDWWFRAAFDAPGESAILGCDGIATCAQAWLNGEAFLSSTNMFVSHECDIAPLLRAGGNELMIRCRALNHELRTRRARPQWRAPMVSNQQLRWLRTTLLGRTPGWSLPAAPVGPWRDVWLAPRGAGRRVTSLRISPRIESDDGVVECRVELDGDARESAVTLRLSRGGGRWSQPLEWNDARACHEGNLRIAHVERWWPHTHGEPALYDAQLLVQPRGKAAIEIPMAALGFRTIEMDTGDGGFALRVNSVPVFCRGAVWTPLDGVSLRASPAAYDEALVQVRGCGMNMLRVAGTTVYEDDAFYAACAREGVLVWQDFMFANMDYPAHDEPFMRSVETEVRQQIGRLHLHPCLAVLCGNSEAEQQAAMWGALRGHWEPPLFHETLPRLCEELAPGIAYWPSSTHGGALPQQPDAGTSSYWGVGAYLRPPEDARRSNLRFATECLAFSNVPARSTIQRMPGGDALRPHHPAWKEGTPRDLGAGWDFEDVRDHYLEQLHGVDARALRSSDTERYLDLSRVVTGELMHSAFSEWRRPQSVCAGALVLMLRDFRPGAGWGVLDDDGAPKPCWHALRRALQPVTVLVTDEGLNGLHAHVINETARPLRLGIELQAWHAGDVSVARAKRELDVAARGALSIPAASLLDHFMDLNWSYRFGAPPCDVVVCSLRNEEGVTIARAHHFCRGGALAVEHDVGLRAEMTRLDACTVQVKVAARRFASGVHMDFPGMVADDDYFHLAPGDEVAVVLRSRAHVKARGEIRAINSLLGAHVSEDAS